MNQTKSNPNGETAAPDPTSYALRFLQMHNGGELLESLGKALMSVTKDVKGHTKAKAVGVVAVRVNIQGAGGNTVEVSHEVGTKSPKTPGSSEVFFTDELGAFHERNPKQRELFNDGMTGLGKADAFEIGAPLPRNPSAGQAS